MRLNYCKCDLCGYRWELTDKVLFQPKSMKIETHQRDLDRDFKDLCERCFHALKAVTEDAIRERLNARAAEIQEEETNVV